MSMEFENCGFNVCDDCKIIGLFGSLCLRYYKLIV